MAKYIEPVMIVSALPDNDDADLLRNKLREFNRNAVGIEKEFAFYARNKQDEVVGGILVTAEKTSIFIDILFVDDKYRGKGIGTKLMLAAEKEAIKRNIHYSTTDTFDFQAVNFYLANGYESIGIIKNYIEGHDKHYFRKKLNH